ncbi:hypothetical protein CPJCM30710_06830 [Clostridium polyendosporum]|uniref:Uncharacterized protein n=1 Tax=Clostridium polyendosporum TaxID=69208 RepID=A0A919RWZ8_9CLOT|nr:hypothetical protein CPJCM30710_06830 [Clostridium polyendosporum]
MSVGFTTAFAKIWPAAANTSTKNIIYEEGNISYTIYYKKKKPIIILTKIKTQLIELGSL